MILRVIDLEEEKTFSDIKSCLVQTQDGWIQILPGHQPFLTDCLPGFVHIQSQQKHLLLQIRKGLLKVTTEYIQIITTQCEIVSLDKNPSDLARYEELKNALEKKPHDADLLDQIQWLEQRVLLWSSK